MIRLFIFGLGYTSTKLAEYVTAMGDQVSGTTRTANTIADNYALGFDDSDAVCNAVSQATHILSSIPPDGDSDPVLQKYRDALSYAPARWIGYLSSSGVYGDCKGAWLDESAPIGAGRRSARSAADLAWQNLGKDVHIFRLPGIYGPGRNNLDRLLSGKAHRINAPGQIFNHVHVDDIVRGIVAGFDGPAGIYNLSDDHPCSQVEIIDYACAILGIAPPPLQTIEQAGLSATARGFYSESRRVSNLKAKRVLGWTPLYPDYRAGLRALSAITSPISTNIPPEPASRDQR